MNKIPALIEMPLILFEKDCSKKKSIIFRVKLLIVYSYTVLARKLFLGHVLEKTSVFPGVIRENITSRCSFKAHVGEHSALGLWGPLSPASSLSLVVGIHNLPHYGYFTYKFHQPPVVCSLTQPVINSFTYRDSI